MIKTLNARQRRRISRMDAETLVEALASRYPAFAEMLAAMVHWLRCAGSDNAAQRLDMLLQALAQQPEACAFVGRVFHDWLQQLRLYPGLVSVGLFSRHGLMREIRTRVYDRFNPPPQSPQNLQDVLSVAFDHESDGEWLAQTDTAQWAALYALLSRAAGEEQVRLTHRHLQADARFALEMLSLWVAAEELDPDLVRLDERLLDVDSPFVALKREISRLLREEHEEGADDDAHARVMIDQCYQKIAHLRRRGIGVGSGSSVAVAHLLQRLEQTLQRLEALLDIYTAETAARQQARAIRLCGQLVRACAGSGRIAPLWRDSVKMMSQSITQNTSRHGEHYITRNRSAFWRMFASASGAGVVVALMALNKIYIGTLGLGPGLTTLLVCLNYGLGFMLVHMLNFTIASKQPAMTAASVAAAVQRNEKGRAQSSKLALLLLDVHRTQSIAVAGNVLWAIVVAVLLSVAAAQLWDVALVDSTTAAYLLKANSPIAGLSLYYAAIAALWLFCSGIIAGFFDNRADYLQLDLRIQSHPLLVHLLRPSARKRLGQYLHANYGSLASNFIFGVLLGITGYIGYLTGLPLDIRHVAFAAANLGYASALGMGVLEFAVNLLFVILIGLVNLWASFTLALIVALRARETRLSSLGSLYDSLKAHIRERPWGLVYPPKDGAEADKGHG